MSPQKSKNILERLDAGEVIIGDGSYCNTLEKRGYVKVQSSCRCRCRYPHTRCPQAGCYTPESSVEHPEAVATLAEEFSRAGADITQVTGYSEVCTGVIDNY